MLIDLAGRYANVIGIDTSEEMLAQASKHVKSQDNIELKHGDASDLFIHKDNIPGANLVTCNMVLHHVPAPEKLIESAANILDSQGLLLITELCAHDQKWTREHCGDLWMGFEQEDIDRWAKSFKLIPASNHSLALRNGFQIQVLIYRKG